MPQGVLSPVAIDHAVVNFRNGLWGRIEPLLSKPDAHSLGHSGTIHDPHFTIICCNELVGRQFVQDLLVTMHMCGVRFQSTRRFICGCGRD